MNPDAEHAVNPVAVFAWKAAKLHQKFVGAAAPEYSLTQNEKDVLLFLYNNKPLDTAGDIVKYRSISKSLVAKSVKSLSARGFLQQIPDQNDGRYVHLKILPAAQDAVSQLKEAQNALHAALASRLSPEDQQELRRLLGLIMAGIDHYL